LSVIFEFHFSDVWRLTVIILQNKTQGIQSALTNPNPKSVFFQKSYTSVRYFGLNHKNDSMMRDAFKTNNVEDESKILNSISTTEPTPFQTLPDSSQLNYQIEYFGKLKNNSARNETIEAFQNILFNLYIKENDFKTPEDQTEIIQPSRLQRQDNLATTATTTTATTPATITSQASNDDACYRQTCDQTITGRRLSYNRLISCSIQQSLDN
jgi:hypothetical protein